MARIKVKEVNVITLDTSKVTMRLELQPHKPRKPYTHYSMQSLMQGNKQAIFETRIIEQSAGIMERSQKNMKPSLQNQAKHIA